MNCTTRNAIACCLSVFCLATLTSTAHAQWTVPTDEELKMTSQPEVPGAAAVYLFREEITDDKQQLASKYVRLKVLTEAGKKYANVEVTHYIPSEYSYTVNGFMGRTIHPDGTIVPFTGGSTEKLVERGRNYEMMATILTLPEVEVGSIIEYRYEFHYHGPTYDFFPASYLILPRWHVQSELYTRKAHYLWRPISSPLDYIWHEEMKSSVIAWAPILPKGFEVKQTRFINRDGSGHAILELDIHNIAPLPDEDHMPPLDSMAYRVRFYVTPYRSADQYWKNEGNAWSRETDKFIGPGRKVREAVKQLVGPSDTNDQKLRKIYAAVMKLDNTLYRRSRSAAEEKSEAMKEPNSTDDILERKRGTDEQIAQLFVAMARVAGMKAYAMRVTNRDRDIFLPQYLDVWQMYDTVAIVNVDGKEQFFDPGERYCEYGHLAWQHTLTSGLRQTDGGSALAETPGELFTASSTQRAADLTLDERGEMKGTVKMTWTGAPALTWRQSYLGGDATSLNQDLRVAMEHLLPNSIEVKVGVIENLEDYEQPLVVSYDVKGQLGAITGLRLTLPRDIFEANTKPTFVPEKREWPVAFEYANTVQDMVRVNFPPSMRVESVPVGEHLALETSAVYALKTEVAPSSFTVRREFDLGTVMYKVDDYAALRDFYNKLESKDQEPIVLNAAAPAAFGN